MKKRIGISFTKTNLKYYLNWFTKEDLQNDIELIDLSFEKNNEADICTCDGFILTGGIDIDPTFYGGNVKYKNMPKIFQPERDRFEEKIYKYSQSDKKPLLGICRGLQLVNVLHGGKLIQDLQSAKNINHDSVARIDGKHEVKTEKDTLLFNITLADKGAVNSAHHQAIDPNAVGSDLKVNAYSTDTEQIIEGIEFLDKSNKAFMLCVQWHPERMNDQSPFSKNIKTAFLEAVAPQP